MNYLELSTLIQTHPSWPAVDDATLTVWVNEEAISADHPTLTSGEVFATIADNISEFNALTDADKQTVRDVLYIHSGEGIPTVSGTAARTLLVTIFGGGSTTITALAAAISYQVSRAVDAGIIGIINEGHIIEARRLAGI